MPIPDDYRRYLQATNALQKDARGREVLSGLTFAETHEYLAFPRNSLNPDPAGPTSQRYFALARRHASTARRITGLTTVEQPARRDD